MNPRNRNQNPRGIIFGLGHWQVGQPSEEYLQHVHQQLLQEKQVRTWEQRVDET